MRRLLSMLTAAIAAAGALAISVPIVATPALACTPVWTVYHRADTFIATYDRNHQRTAHLEYTIIVQVTTNCPGPQYGRRSTTVQIDDGTPFNARVTVFKPVLNPYQGVCDQNYFGATYDTTYVQRVTVFTLYGAQYDLLNDSCWAHAADGGNAQGTLFFSLIASDGSPYFQPTVQYAGGAVASQNYTNSVGLYTPPDVI